MEDYWIKKEKEYNLAIGDRLFLKWGSFKEGLFNSSEIIYAGMSEDEKRYLINVFEERGGFLFRVRSDRGQLWFPRENKTLKVSNVELEVLEVTPFNLRIMANE